MLNIDRIKDAELNSHPFVWARIDQLYSREDAQVLAQTFPRDHFKVVSGYGGEKDYEYEARLLKPMGSDDIAFPSHLSDAWLRLARDLGSPAYRVALSHLTDRDLGNAPIEVNVFHYGPGASLGAHADLDDKIVTHVLYFNTTWNRADGGCLTILHGNDISAVSAVIEPRVGNSAVLVRSDHSWHAVSPVVGGCSTSRRSVTVTFYRPGALSSMWPEGDTTALHEYVHG
jgi:SM-20-related protein